MSSLLAIFSKRLVTALETMHNLKPAALASFTQLLTALGKEVPFHFTRVLSKSRRMPLTPNLLRLA
mgnify:CR=1 FL=1